MSSKLYAWPTVPDGFDIEPRVSLDGSVVPRRHIDSQHRRVDLTDIDASWDLLSIDVRGPDPIGTEHGPEAKLYALVNCPSTAQILPFVAKRDEGSFAAQVEIARHEIARRATLEVRVVGAAGLDPAEGLRTVGASAPWTLVLEPQAGPTSHGPAPITVIWADFAQAVDGPHEVLGALPHSLSFCDFEQGEPILYLNDGVSGLRELLNDPHAKGTRKETQQVLGSHIALDTVSSLVDAGIQAVIRAARDIDPEDGIADLGAPSQPVLRTALEHVTDASDSFNGLDDLLERVVTAVRDEDSVTLDTIQSELRSSAQMAVSTQRAVERLIKAVSDV